VKLIEDLHKLKGKKISNKSKKGVMITRLIEIMVFVEFAMKIFNPQDSKCYLKVSFLSFVYIINGIN
jgi:hypothetical protein